MDKDFEWNFIDLKDARIRGSLGNKAVSLGELMRAGFRVPQGWVLSREATQRILDHNGQTEAIARELRNLDGENARAVAARIRELTAGLTLPEELVAELSRLFGTDHKYAVRSSGTLEDLDDASFAGQYDSFLNISAARLPEKILACLRSMWGEPILSYLGHRGLDPASAGMAVIVQEMVQADVAGVIFSVNPTTGADTEVVIEVVRGLGDALVSGQLIPESYRYDWYGEKGQASGGAKLLTKGQVMLLAKRALRIQKLYGFPVDVEFAMVGGRAYALQTRPVTRINFNGLKDQWTTADFKDGGVSATVCKPLMWSLYEYVWERELKRFMLESSILTEGELRKLSRMFYGRPYWNMSVVKTAMAKVPGFRERDFDAEFGVQAGYEGDGIVTRATPASLAKFLKIGLAQKKILGERERSAQRLKEELLAGYDSVRAALPTFEGEDLKNAWIRLVRDLYLKSEGTYFWQIFINTIHQSISRDDLTKYADLKTYYALIGGLTNVSHLRPFYDLWELSREVLKDDFAVRYWLDSDPAVLQADLMDPDKTSHFLPDFRGILARYDYHSDRELDISWPDYDEDPASFINSFRDTLKLSDEFSPDAAKLKVHREYLAALEQISKTHGPLARSKVQKKIEKTRTMLWWREEYRDLSTRYYHLIRLYSLKLSKLLVQEGVLGESSDLWYLKLEDIIKLLEGRSTGEFAAGLIRQNRSYYESFRNFMSDDEIGEGFGKILNEPEAGILLRGVAGSTGTVRGAARVVQGLAEMDRIRPGDILVTKFTDTGWTSKFAMLSGVITEFGGALCHAAIVSREYGIPCIVGAKDAMILIRDGDIIVMDGATGEIRREEV